MTLILKFGKFQKTIATYYYLIMVVVYTASVYLLFIRTGLFMTFLLIGLLYGFHASKKGGSLPSLVTLFIIYSLLSIQGYFYNGIPISAYFGDLSSQVFPIIFFYISYYGLIDKDSFYKSYRYAMVFAIIIGLYYYIVAPPVYVNFMARTSNPNYEGEMLGIPRFGSIFNSTVMGTFAVILYILSFYSMVYDGHLKKGKLYLFVICVISFITVFLTNQRGAMVMVAFCSIVLMADTLLNKKKQGVFIIIVLSILIAVLMPVAILQFGDFFDLWNERIESLDTAVDGRSDQWYYTLTNSPNIILGSGLGSVGHKAVGFAKYTITDGSLFKYLAEFGVVGSILFFIIVARPLLGSLCYFKIYIREYLVILVCVGQSVGSNTLSMQQILPIFWYCLGLLACNSRQITQLKSGNNSILPTTVSSHTA